MLSAYLLELEGELARSHSADEVRVRLAEAEDHLREAVDGRLELGQDRETAECEAVAAFGRTRAVAAASPPVVARRRWLAAYFATLALTVAVYGTLEQPSGGFKVVFVSGCCVATIGFGLASFRSRRPRPGEVLRTCLISTAVLWAVVGTFYAGVDWQGVYPRRGLVQAIVGYRAMLAGEAKGSGTLPGGPPGKPYDEFLRAHIADLERARREPLMSAVRTLPAVAYPGATSTALALMIDLGFGGLGFLLYGRRPRRPRVA